MPHGGKRSSRQPSRAHPRCPARREAGETPRPGGIETEFRNRLPSGVAVRIRNRIPISHAHHPRIVLRGRRIRRRKGHLSPRFRTGPNRAHAALLGVRSANVRVAESASSGCKLTSGGIEITANRILNEGIARREPMEEPAREGALPIGATERRLMGVKGHIGIREVDVIVACTLATRASDFFGATYGIVPHEDRTTVPPSSTAWVPLGVRPLKRMPCASRFPTANCPTPNGIAEHGPFCAKRLQQWRSATKRGFPITS